MLDAGFSMLESKILAKPGEISYKLPVLDKSISYIEVKNTVPISAVVPKGCTDITHTVELPRTLVAPIRKGDVIGKVTYRIDNKVIATASLIAMQDVLPQRRGILSLF
jgi:D-alanyl-D-alanine carboxypeptidase (penicillin-binding protein 5/6)